MKVLISDPVSDLGLEILKEAGIESIYLPKPKLEDIKENLSDIDGWIVRSGTKVTRDLLEKTKKLQVIGRAGVGVDNIDIHSATLQGIVVMNTPDGNTVSAAEHSMAMMSSLARNIQIGHSDLVMGKWNRHSLVGSELRGKILGIVGLGRIGREVVKRALSYEMKVLGFDPYVNKDIFDQENMHLVDLDTLTKESDFITLHVPLLDSTRNLFDSKRLKMMKSSARIINVARGGLINEKDLADALNNDIIAGAAVDVFETEPLVNDHPLLTAKNILLTPHLGASTAEAKEGVSKGICKQVADFLVNEKLSNALNMPVNDLSLLKTLAPYLHLAEILGKIQIQLSNGAIKSVHVECFGPIEDTKTVSLSFIKGLLENISGSRINFINAHAVAEERGISISHTHNSDQVSFSNLIITHVEGDSGTIEVAGSVFGDSHSRIVDIMGFEVDVRPEGNMLFMKNKDVPGVIGKVGTLIGSAEVNIGEYLLSRTSQNETAYAVVKLDSKLNKKLLESLSSLDEIIDIRQLSI